MAIVSKYIIEKAALKLSISKELKSLEHSFLDALNNNFNKLQNLISQLIKAYRSTPKEERKWFGIESLKIFNLKNDKGQTVIMLAAKYGRADLLKKWYYIPSDLTNDEYLPKELLKVYELLVSSYIAQDNDGNNALMLAVKSGNSACLPFLLSPETAITLNQKDKDGKTALVHAIESRNLAVIKELLEVAEVALTRVNQYNTKLEVAEAALTGVNQRDSKIEVKLELDTSMLNFIQNIEDEETKYSVKKFLGKLAKHICYTDMPKLMHVSKLKSNNTTDTIPTIHKSPKEVETIIIKLPSKRKNHENTKNQGNGISPKKGRQNSETVGEVIQKLTHFMKKAAPFSTKLETLDYLEGCVSNTRTEDAHLTSCCANKAHQKPEILEEKCQKIGQFLLEKLLHEADSSNLTDNKKKKILDYIETLVKKAKIEFPEDLVQNIQMPDKDMRGKVFNIITQDNEKEKNGPNSQLDSTTNGFAEVIHISLVASLFFLQKI